jgi:hypothetical protein
LVTAAIIAVTVVSWVGHWDLVVVAWGSDYEFFLGVAHRWLSNGQFYQPHQLAGPYVAAINVDTLYPPAALVLFLPFVWLPAILWWVIPLGIIAFTVVLHRPQVWVWPFLALMLWWPRTQSIIVWGSTGMWIAAFIALAIRFRWMAALVMLKPSLAPFALLGVGSRGWWVAGVVLAAVSAPMLPDYLAALRNNVGPYPGLDYSIQDIPFLAIPVIAWLARSQQPRYAQNDRRVVRTRRSVLAGLRR